MCWLMPAWVGLRIHFSNPRWLTLVGANGNSVGKIIGVGGGKRPCSLSIIPYQHRCLSALPSTRCKGAQNMFHGDKWFKENKISMLVIRLCSWRWLWVCSYAPDRQMLTNSIERFVGDSQKPSSLTSQALTGNAWLVQQHAEVPIGKWPTLSI